MPQAGSDSHNAQQFTRLMALAADLRKEALAAGRPDVAGKVDEAILLLADVKNASRGEEGKNEASNVVVRILDGLGF